MWIQSIHVRFSDSHYLRTLELLSDLLRRDQLLDPGFQIVDDLMCLCRCQVFGGRDPVFSLELVLVLLRESQVGGQGMDEA